jgi:hypothetical protein
VHYSGHEDDGGPLSSGDLNRKIDERRRERDLNPAFTVLIGEQGWEWPPNNGLDPTAPNAAA